jgi:hypothetical protein
MPSSLDIEIEYVFLTKKSLQDRLESASSAGEVCTWTVTTGSSTRSKSGSFWFSNGADLVGKLQSSGTSFSADDGAWGAATGHVNANCDPALTGNSKCPSDFWGVMNKNSQDNGKWGCNYVYSGDLDQPTAYNSVRTIMYLVKDASLPPLLPAPGPSPVVGCMPPACVYCDFEAETSFSTNAYCSTWKNDDTATTTWTRNSGRTPSSSTGPTGAAEGQHYLYFEVSTPRIAGNTVRLRSAVVSLGAHASMGFKYHMLGATLGTLRVKVLVNSAETLVWEKTGQQGADWYDAHIKLKDFVSYQVEIIIEAERGSDWRGDIAIDEIILNTEGGFVHYLSHAVPTSQLAAVGREDELGRIDVSQLSSILGAMRLWSLAESAAAIRSEEGQVALRKALSAIFGRTVQVIATCAAAETVEAQCPDTRRVLNISSEPHSVPTSSSLLHIDFRIKIKFGSIEEASEVLAELSRIEGGEEDALSEAVEELEIAFDSTTVSVGSVAVLESPQPLQLKYKQSQEGSDEDTDTSPTVEAENGRAAQIPANSTVDPKGKGDDAFSWSVLTVTLAISGAVLLFLLVCLAVLVFRMCRRRRSSHLAKNASVDDGVSATTSHAEVSASLRVLASDNVLEASVVAEVVLEVSPEGPRLKMRASGDLEESEMPAVPSSHIAEISMQKAAAADREDEASSEGTPRTGECLEHFSI